jgi:hypothetical protein
MTETLLVVRNEVKSLALINNTAEDSRIDSQIRTAIRQLQGKQYWFLEKIGAVALSVGVTSVAAPTDYSILGSASIVYNGRRYSEYSGEFAIMSYEDLENEYLYNSPVSNKAYPDAMAIVGSTFYLSHTTTEASSLSLRYFKKDVSLPINTSDTSVFFGDESLDVVIGLSHALFEARAQGAVLSSEVVNSFIQKLDRENERRVMVGVR